jgi:hypothetical protein
MEGMKKEKDPDLEQDRERANSLSENQEMPPLPEGPMTTAEMGVSMFDMAHEAKFKALANLLTKTDLPGMKRGLYMNAINTALILHNKGMPKTAAVLMNRAATDLMAMVSEKGKRVEQFLKPIELELHRERLKQDKKDLF